MIMGSCSLFLVFTVVFVTMILPPGLDGDFVIYHPYFDCRAASSCNNFTQLKYPFAESSLPSYCGYPGFQVECEDGELTLVLGGRQFRILDIDREKQLVTVTLTNILEDICPEKLSSYSFNNGSFSISENTMAAKILSATSCHHAPSLDPDDIYTCSNNRSNHTGHDNSSTHVYYLSISDGVQENYSKGCQLITEVLMLKKAVADFSSKKIAAAEALKQGFELNWAAVDMSICSICEFTGGVCGYNASLARFSCFCIDGSHRSNCSFPLNDHEFDQPRGKNAKKRYLIAGVSVTVAFVILAIAISLLVVYRKKVKDNCSTTCTEVTTPKYPELTQFEFNDLREATNYFDKVVGSGANSNVHHGTLKDGREVAVKRMFGRRDEQFMNELNLLSSLHHQNLVDLYGYCCNDDINMLVYEYISNGTLADHLRGEGERAKEFLPWSARISIAIEIARTLVYLHASNVVHCDVKSDNILIDHNLSAKLGDFGISRLVPENTTHLTTTAHGTDGYLAPECDGRSRCQTTSKRDVFSFGVVLMELVSAKPATEGIDEYLSDTAMEMIDNGKLDEFVDQRLWAEADTITRKMIELVAYLGYKCLRDNKNERPGMEVMRQRLEDIRDGKTEDDDSTTDHVDSVSNVDSDSGGSIVLRSHSFPGTARVTI